MMKISYKKFGAFAATAVLAGILAGCGSGMNADANDMARPAAMQQEKAAGRTQNFMDAKEFVKLLKEHRVDTVNLLPFHQFGEKKYEELQVPYQLKDVKALRPEDMTEYYNVFKNAGLNVSM